MPDGGVGWTGLWLRAMRRAAIQLSFLRQPALSQVPWSANRAMARKTAHPALALPVLSADLYRAFGVARAGPFGTEAPLWTAAEHGSGEHSKTLCRSKMAGRTACVA